MQKVIFTIGLPGSGKSTWALEQCKKDKTYIRVNRDDLRLMRGKYWLPEQEGLITEWEIACIKAGITEGLNVIVDATNLNLQYRARIKFNVLEMDELFEHNIIFEEKYFNTSLDECIKRDAERPKERRCGATVIKRMYYHHVCKPNYVVPNPSLPKTIICDLDGTLAILGDRDVYDYSKVNLDTINESVNRILKGYDGYVIFVSGRDDSCLELTKQWLDNNDIYYSNVFMRKTGDKRKDSIVKKEIFDLNIRDKYNIEFILDDRSQVVEMWRNELGLKCLQVAEGDF